MSDNNAHSVRTLGRPPKVWLGVRTLCISLLLTTAPIAIAKADCPASPGGTNDLLISFLAANNTQAAPALLHASTVKEGMLVYDDTDNVLKLCDGDNWVEVGDGGLAAHGVAGAVQFSDGAGGLLSDNSNLHWDDAGNRLGVGTASPNAKLHVYGAGNNGGAALFEAGAWNSVTIKGVNGAGVQDSAFLKFEDASGENTFIGLTGTAGANGGNVGDLRIGVSGERVRISKTTGYVGIGNVPLPRARLHVNGGVKLGDDADVCPGASNIKLGTLKYASNVLNVCNTTGWTAIDIGGVGGATPAGNDGSIQFKSGSNLAADTANLHWDNTNKRLGIGTTTPSSALHVPGGAKFGTIVETSSYAAHTVILSDGGTAFEGGLLFNNTDSSASGNSSVKLSSAFSAGASNVDFHLGVVNNDNPNTYVRSWLYGDGPTGNIGIGTTTPQSLLQVAGGIQLGDDTAACPGASNIKVGTLRYNGGALQVCGTGGWAGVSGSGGTLTDGDKTDITVSGTGTVWTIDNNAVTTAKIANSNVTNTKLANMAANTIKGNNTGSAAAPLDLTVAQLATMLDGTGTFVLKAGDTMTGRLVNTGALTASQDMATATSNLGAFEARSQGSAGTAGAAFITFHRPSNQAVYFGLDTDNQLKVGGWSMGANAYKLWHENNDGSGSTLDADLLDGMNAVTTATANTVVARDTNGDTTVRYLMSTYLNMSHAQATRNADTIFYSSTDNYLRKNNASGFRTSLDVYSKGEVDALAGSVTDGDKGDITVSGTGATWTIDAGAVNSAKVLDGAIATADLANSNVTYAKIQNVSATSRLLGRASAGAGIIEELTIGSGLSLVGTTLTATGGGADNLGHHTATQDLNMTGSYKITFGAPSPLPADLLHLWNNTYGIGIETATLTNWSGSQFRWRIGGASVSAGTERMLLTASGLTVNGAFSATSLIGSGTSLTNLNASNLASGTVATARLGSGTANSSVFLRGDGTWAAPPSGADNLGNHAATQNLNLNGYDLTGVRQIIGGFGVMSTTGTLDWNDASNARSGNGTVLLLGTASNGPGPGTYFYPFSFEYPSMNGTGQITQFAIPYSASAHLDSGLFIRGRYTGTWSGWRKILTENTSGAVSISGTMTANAFSGSGASLTSLNASNLASGTVAPARLGTGTANSSTYLRGDGTWAAAAGDNLGNHTATTTLNVNSQLMAGVAQITGSAWHANYDVWLQGGVNGASGSARKLALLGYKVSDHLYVNYGSEYAGGTIIGGPVGITYAPSYTLDVQSGTVRATAYLYTSDARLKKDVRTLSGLDIVTRLRGVSFKWKDSGKAATGVIAQEIEAVLPTAVSTDKSGIKSVDYQQLTVPLIEAIKELKADNDNLRATNDNQSVAIDSLRAEVEALKRLTGGAR